MGRFADVRSTLKDDQRYSSSNISLNPILNPLARQGTLASDGEAHTRRRKVLMHSLAAKALVDAEPIIDRTADAVVEDLLTRPSFDGVQDFAARLPVSVVADLVGIPVTSDQLLRWGRDIFDSNAGIRNVRGWKTSLRSFSVFVYTARLRRSQMRSNGWAASVLDAADRGEIGPIEARNLIMDFAIPSLDTTLLATAEMLWSLGRQPEAWQALRRQPELVPAAVMESVRLASPVRFFVRTVTEDHDIDGVALHAGDRIATIFASANMDDTQFPEPERFSLERRGSHVGWGFGAHACVGMHLSRIEMTALLRAMLPRVEHIEVSGAHRLLNNGLQGYSRFRAAFRPVS
ncbi:cytochrome P450 [Mycolicibacterium holsaticum]|uniref:cytochrome P450 n=1 Tax=Mycolicibacterium holsaticum TaxID=152142 RepID=UPI001E3949DA|nr:cytochrome P450 [Mycolicibacterium holsaticum]